MMHRQHAPSPLTVIILSYSNHPTKVNHQVSVTMPRWGPKHNKVLAELFNEGIADPEITKSDYIDPIRDIDALFADVTVERFRENYKNCATKYMTGMALNGVRRSESSPSSPIFRFSQTITRCSSSAISPIMIHTHFDTVFSVGTLSVRRTTDFGIVDIDGY
mmetsp:Transcript_22074/g.51912  ORF Transcript_22074/g.51912 Transcript_22074/m.51912 type:complete len:162 (+) Transcript_22074:70-555(+)